MKPTMTYALANAAGMDAGNRSMRKAGRKRWSKDDYNAAYCELVRITDQITPTKQEATTNGNGR